MITYAAKELHFNRNGEALKRMQAGVDKLASVVGVTLGPKVSLCPCASLQKRSLSCWMGAVEHDAVSMLLPGF